MSVIKFRAWNKESKQYVPAMTIQEIIYSTKNKFSLQQLYEWFIFEQYTGFKDDAGKEIFDGDIVVILNDYGRDIGIVKKNLDDGYWAVKFEGNLDEYLQEWVVDGCVIIGNIFENPKFSELN